MEFGLFPATIDFATVRESARTAEELGYDLVVGRGHAHIASRSGGRGHT